MKLPVGVTKPLVLLALLEGKPEVPWLEGVNGEVVGVIGVTRVVEETVDGEAGAV